MDRKFPPDTIFLVIEDEAGNIARDRWEGEISWCDDQIYDSDVEYIKMPTGDVVLGIALLVEHTLLYNNGNELSINAAERVKEWVRGIQDLVND